MSILAYFDSFAIIKQRKLPMEIKRKKVLVVEDDDTLRTLLADHLKGDYDISQAEDGQKGLESALQNKPDLILLDLLLPNLGGLELLERLRQHPDNTVSSIKVIILSNLASSDTILKAKALYVSDYLVKADTDLDKIYVKIDEVLSQPPPKQQGFLLISLVLALAVIGILFAIYFKTSGPGQESAYQTNQRAIQQTRQDNTLLQQQHQDTLNQLNGSPSAAADHGAINQAQNAAGLQNQTAQ